MPRISPGTIVVGIFAVLFGLVGAYAVREHFREKEVAPVVQERPREQVFTVPLASIDLEPGRPLTLSDVAVLRLNPEQLKKYELPAAYMSNPNQIIGRTLREPVGKGKAFLPEAFYPEGFGPSIAERLKPGHRAMTVPIDSTSAVAGMATPGSTVDVLFRTDPDVVSGLPETTVRLLEDVEVLAFNQNIVPNSKPNVSDGEITVTLAVTPQQASALKVVHGKGTLSLALRGREDDQWISYSEPETLESLLGVSPQMTKTTFTTSIYRGTNQQTLRFDAFGVEQPATVSFEAPVGRQQTVSTDSGVQPPAAPAQPDDSSQSRNEVVPIPINPLPRARTSTAAVRLSDPSETGDLAAKTDRTRIGLSGQPLPVEPTASVAPPVSDIAAPSGATADAR